jgi:hypothetical protein
MTRQILKVIIPYIDSIHSKARPVLQLNNPCDERGHFQVAYITSKKPVKSYHTDIEVTQADVQFNITGLTKTSYIRLSKIFTIRPDMVDAVIGQLPDKIDSNVSGSLKLNFFIKS